VKEEYYSQKHNEKAVRNKIYKSEAKSLK